MKSTQGSGYLKALYDVLEFHSQLKDPEEDKVWSRIVEKLSVALDAEAATYYSYLATKRQLLPRYALGVSAADLKGTPVDIRTGLSGWVALHREPLVIEDAYQDQRFLREVDQVTGFKTKSVLAVPLIERLDLIGVIQLLNKRQGAFTEEDLDFTQAICGATVTALRACKLESVVDKVTARNASIIENLGGGFMAVDTHGRLMLCNPAARRILGLAAELPLNSPLEQSLVHIPRFSDILLDTLASRKTAKRQEFTYSFKGEKKVLGYSTILISDPNGEITGAGISFQDITNVKS